KTISRYCWQRRSDECAVWLNQVVHVMQVTTIHAVLCVDSKVDTDIVFSVVEWVRLLERRVVCGWSVCVGNSKSFHCRKHRRYRLSVCDDLRRRNDVARETTGANCRGGDHLT